MLQVQQREAAILNILISKHVNTGEPVGSRAIARSGLGLSSATVRNSMADLEEKGLLTHPHTSAGRVPTDKGYRYYVDKVMPRQTIEEEEREKIRERVRAYVREGDIEALLEQMSKLIADLSMNLGMVLSPRFERGVFDRLEMVHLSEGRLLLVLAIKSGLVKTMVMEVDSAITPGELDETSRAVNERLSGLSVAEIRDSVAERLREVSSGSPRLLRVLCDSALNLFRFQSGMDLHFGGAGNFIMQPEFNRKKNDLAALMALLEAREPMITILDERTEHEGISVTIGSENGPPQLQGCSVLTSRYRVGAISGVIGLIGPTRIPYARLIPLTRYMATLAEEMLDHQ